MQVCTEICIKIVITVCSFAIFYVLFNLKRQTWHWKKKQTRKLLRSLQKSRRATAVLKTCKFQKDTKVSCWENLLSATVVITDTHKLWHTSVFFIANYICILKHCNSCMQKRVIHLSNMLRSTCMTSSSFQFLPLFPVFLTVLLSVTYFPFIRSLSRCILFLPHVAFPLILPSLISCSNDSHLIICPNHTFTSSHRLIEFQFHLLFVALLHYLFCPPN